MTHLRGKNPRPHPSSIHCSDMRLNSPSHLMANRDPVWRGGCGADSLLSESRAMVDLPHRGGWSLRNHTAGHRSETIKVQLDSLPKLNRTELRERWRDSYGSDPPEKISELLMQQAIAHRLQLKYLGGLNFSTRRTLKRVLEESGATHPNPRSRSKPITIGCMSSEPFGQLGIGIKRGLRPIGVKVQAAV